MTKADAEALPDEERLRELAIAAEAAGRYDDMKQRMKERVAVQVPLTNEERDLLSVAFKGALSTRRHAVFVVSQAIATEDSASGHADIAAKYRRKLEAELLEVCEEVLALLRTKLVPAARAGEPRTFFLKMQGDYQRYSGEFAQGDARMQAARSAKTSYHDALQEAGKHLLPSHPVSLATSLNYAVLQHEVFKDVEAAIQIARHALDAASAFLDAVTEDANQDVADTIQALRDNVAMWEGARAAAANNPTK